MTLQRTGFNITHQTLTFHYGSFDNSYSDGNVSTAATNGHIYDNTPTGTGSSGSGFGGDGLYEVSISGTTYNFATIFGETFGEVINNESWFAGGGGTYALPIGGKGGGGDGSQITVGLLILVVAVVATDQTRLMEQVVGLVYVY